MHFSAENAGRTLTLHVSGRMTHSDYKEFDTIRQMVDEGGPSRIVFDLSGVDFMDSSALGMLLIVRDNAMKASRTVVLQHAHGAVAKLLQIGKLHNYFEVEE